jgi:integrase/recombinase XerD
MSCNIVHHAQIAMADLVPLESLVPPPTLTGENGRNRAPGLRQIDANDDRSAVLAWLARYADSPATLSSYRKESERLLMWCILQRGRALSDLAHEDLLAYQRFLADPQPAERWVMRPGLKPSRSSPQWRPFAGPLSPSSQRQAMSILNGLFNWLVEAGYLTGNPLALRRRAKVAARPRQLGRFLPQEHWKAVRATIQAMDRGTPREAAHADRARWLFSLLYVGGVRVSEVCSLTMGSFYAILDAAGRQRWWIEVTGKGSKTRLVPATDELMAELMRYRVSNDLKPLPSHGDDMPAVLPLVGPPTFMVRTAVYEVVKAVMRLAADQVRKLGPEHEATAAHIERASPHWMRHTAGTHSSDRMDLKAVRDNLGHANLATTSIYVHSEDNVRHDATTAGHRVDWAPDA